MPPRKKRRTHQSVSDTPNTPPSPAPETPELGTWPGWCEIESEPAFFNTILHEMGICHLRIHEVFGVDDTALAILPKPVHAVIFLFRYQHDAAEQIQETACPPHVWFANQIPQYACGTVALLNIVNNIPNLDLGQPLQSFKDFTQSFDPVARGYAIDSFDFLRKIHNSFARDTDMLAIDSQMKEKNVRMMKKQKTAAATAARVAKAAEKAAGRAAKASEQPSKLRSNPSRKARTSNSLVEADDAEQEEESGFHFIAYMPIGNDVWKLDGLDSFPTTIGKTQPGQDWLSVVQTTLSVRMAEYEEGQIQFSLMAVVQDPVIEDRHALAQNVRSLRRLEAHLDEVSKDWRNFSVSDPGDKTIFGPSEEYGLTEETIAKASQTEKMEHYLKSNCPENLTQARQELIRNQAQCRAAVRDSQQAEVADAEESMHRRHDYGAFVKAWMQALVDNGALKSLLDDNES